MTKTIYKDKNQNEIKAGMYIYHDSGDIEEVIDGDEEIGINASNPNYKGNNITNAKIYPLHQFNLSEWEIIKAFAICHTPTCQQAHPLQYFGTDEENAENVRCEKCGRILVDHKGHLNLSLHPHAKPALEREQGEHEYLQVKRIIDLFDMNDKSEVSIYNYDSNEQLYIGRVDYLQFNKDGVMSELCSLEIKSLDVSNGIFSIYVS